MEQMMTAAFDDTVDILDVVHDKALMKDMIAARTVFGYQSSSERKSSFSPILYATGARMCFVCCYHDFSETNGKSARSRPNDRRYGVNAGFIIVDQTNVRPFPHTAALCLQLPQFIARVGNDEIDHIRKAPDP
jgi:hypothetical protein